MKIHDHTIQCKRRGMTITTEVSNVTPIPPPSEVVIILNSGILIHLFFFTVLPRMFVSFRYMKDIVWFSPLLTWYKWNHTVCIFVICFVHSRLRFWDLCISRVLTDVFNLTQTSPSSLCITLTQEWTQFYHLSHQLSLHLYIQHVWLYPNSSIYDLGKFHIFC